MSRCVKTLPHHLYCEEQLGVAEADGGEGNSKAEAKQEHDVGLIVVLVFRGVPVGTTCTLKAFWDVPGYIKYTTTTTHYIWHDQKRPVETQM